MRKRIANIITSCRTLCSMYLLFSHAFSIDFYLAYERLSNALDTTEWIIDGNYASTMELRLNACDTVIFLDYPLEVCLEGVQSRKCKARSDMPWIEPSEDDDEFIEFIKNYNLKNRPTVFELLARYSDKNIFIFKSRAEADEFLARI